MIELLSTKLFITRPRRNLVSRSRLVDRLNAGLDKKLTLIAAPAGFGKTTLLSEWIPQSPRCVTWLSLDESDNDPTRFWTYLISSLQQLNPDMGDGALTLLQSSQTPPITSILTALINDITAFTDEFSTVLDDYHVINSQSIHEALTFLIDHLPGNMNLVMTTRVDPPLPLARMRASDQLTELRANDLRFTVDEATAFLNRVMGFSLSKEEVAALEARTEGWIAGLQIAALSMQSHEDIPGFIQAFSGSHRHILGYLAEEVLNKQSKDTQNFLLQTSILDRLCGSLCDAVTTGTNGQAMLEKLEHVNLFVSPLDDEGRWYRYHHLFAEVLQARLRQSQPELLVELHRHASEWCEAQNLLAEAIQHSLAAGNVARAANLIERERWTLLGRGEANTLHSWLDKLPAEIVSDRPALSLAYAWISTILRQAEAIEPRLQDANKALEAHAPNSSDQAAQIDDAIRGEITLLRAEIMLNQSDIPRAIELCQKALILLPEDNPLMLAFANYFLGHGELRSGHMAEAERAYCKASSLGLQADNLLVALHAVANMSRVQIMMGRLNEAAETSQRILQITAERQGQAWPVAGLAYYGLSKLTYEWNDLDEALRYSRLGIESGLSGGLIGLELNSRKVLAFTLQAQLDPGGADRALQQNAALSERYRHPIHAAEIAAWEARLRLRQGYNEQAISWAETCGLSSEDTALPFGREIEYLTLARVLIAQGKSGAVLELLMRLLQTAESDQRKGSIIEILIILALARQQQGDFPGALDDLERALTLAEPQGYVRTFVDEGDPMRLLLINLQTMLRKKIGTTIDSSSLRLLAYNDKLLAAFSQAALPPAQEPGDVIEPLSDRELDILRLIATGRTNQEIAEILVIATSTVKSHINNLYGKLGTNRRTQAIAIARNLGLLS